MGGGLYLMSNIFISYKREQRDWVRELVSLLESYGLTVWWDPKIEVGEEYFKVINKIITDVDCIIVIWSHDSVDSPWVISEASVGMERNNIIPVLLDEVNPPIPFNILQSANLVNWNGEKEHEGINHLLSSIQKYCQLIIEEKSVEKEESLNVEEKAYFFTEPPHKDDDTKEWKRVLKEDTKSGYKRYLEEFPEGKHQKKARKKLKTLAFKKQMIMSAFIIGVLTVLIVVKKVGG
jgi:hypothetical protein